MNQEQILEEIRLALHGDGGPEDAVTTSDIVRHMVSATGRSEQYLLKIVRPAIARLQTEGRLERVEIRRVSPVDGRNSKLTAYRLVA